MGMGKSNWYPKPHSQFGASAVREVKFNLHNGYPTDPVIDVTSPNISQAQYADLVAVKGDQGDFDDEVITIGGTFETWYNNRSPAEQTELRLVVQLMAP